jgi:spore coat protein U-like protein
MKILRAYLSRVHRMSVPAKVPPKSAIICLLCLGMTVVNAAQAFPEAQSESRAGGAARVSVSAGTLSFGDLEEAGAFNAVAQLVVKAPASVAYALTAGAGLHFSGGTRNLQRQDGVELLSYRLYKDSAGSLPWGDSDFENTYPYGSSLSGSGTGKAQSITLSGRLFVGPAPVPGLYGDSILISIHF